MWKSNCDFVLVWVDVEIVHLLHVAGGGRKPAVTRSAKFCLYITHFIWLEKCRETFALAFAWKSFDITEVWHVVLCCSVYTYSLFILALASLFILYTLPLFGEQRWVEMLFIGMDSLSKLPVKTKTRWCVTRRNNCSPSDVRLNTDVGMSDQIMAYKKRDLSLKLT